MLARLLCPALIAASLFATPAHSACTPPPPPSKVPDGATASAQEMILAMKTFKQYDADATAYLKCLEFETKQALSHAGAGEQQQLRARQAREHNATLDLVKITVDRFNKQVRIYKERAPAQEGA
jgi:hypothetical protein